MQLLTTIHIAARISLIIFCIITIALSTTSLHTWTNAKIECSAEGEGVCNQLESVLSVLAFCAFAGGFGLVDAAIELVLTVGDIGHWGVIVAADALAAVFLVAGGVALSAIYKNKDMEDFCTYGKSALGLSLGKGDCSAVGADAAFLFLGFVAMAISAGARLMEKRAGGMKNSSTSGGGGERHAALEL